MPKQKDPAAPAPAPASAVSVPRRWAAVSAREQLRRRYFPPLELQNQLGHRVKLYEDLIQDKMVVMNFFYATCKGICVPLTANLARLQARFGERMGRDIFFCSFTLEPELDTPAVLAAYARRFKAGPGWQFLTGAPSALELCRRRLGFTDPDPGRDANKLNHTGMVRFGNEPLTLWSACPGLSTIDSLVRSISAVDFYGRNAGGHPAIGCARPGFSGAGG